MTKLLISFQTIWSVLDVGEWMSAWGCLGGQEAVITAYVVSSFFLTTNTSDWSLDSDSAINQWCEGPLCVLVLLYKILSEICFSSFSWVCCQLINVDFVATNTSCLCNCCYKDMFSMQSVKTSSLCI